MAPKTTHFWLHTIAPLVYLLGFTHNLMSDHTCDSSTDPNCEPRTTRIQYGSVSPGSLTNTSLLSHNREGNDSHLNCSFKCEASDKCVTSDQICDLKRDCPKGDDELQSCNNLPNGSYCSFGPNDSCGWKNIDIREDDGIWILNSDKNEWYLRLTFPPQKGAKPTFGRGGTITSPTFPPIPLYHSMESSKYYNSCHVRFLYLLAAPSTELAVELVEKNPVYAAPGNKIQLWREYLKASIHKTQDIAWTRVSVALAHISHKYELRISSFSSFRSGGDNKRNPQIIAVDNISLSKECFGIGFPTPLPPPQAPISPINFTIPTNASLKSFRLSSCGAVGRMGPTFKQCETFYQNSPTRASVMDSSSFIINGTQMWTVPHSGYYTIFARGAKGGHGLYPKSVGGYGALVRAVFKFQEGATIFVLIGQPGADACHSEQIMRLNVLCKQKLKRKRGVSGLIEALNQRKDNYTNDGAGSDQANAGGAGGGGGATYVFQMEGMEVIPLIIAGGGGGGGGGSNNDTTYPKSSQGQHGRGFIHFVQGSNGDGENAGGGWFASHKVQTNTSGTALKEGSYGGYVCGPTQNWGTNGGFGSGGGGCFSGGGGGGYQGGDAYNSADGGQGGTSYVNPKFANLELFTVDQLFLKEDIFVAEVVIFPQIPKCCNNELLGCVVTGETPDGHINQQCVCPDGSFEPQECFLTPPITLLIILSTIFFVILLIVIFSVITVIRYRKSCNVDNRAVYRNGRDASASQLLSNSSTDVQLSRLRSGHNIITEYNPNYEFGGSTCTLQDLREVPREKLTLIKALGQGAFGEVYQGYLHNMPGEITDELPVAVKTLPEYSANNQAEMDFLMEALIMSKFKHRNIVRFIGVCFEKMPRFIVLELLPGGDLKTFLRESRGTSIKPSLLNMGDLLVIALDVALGCQYLEENHFIHRDIAARNCLLSSKTKCQSANVNTINTLFNIINYNNGYNNNGIVVKIADFGMARDIYRADYYRKGGKAMLPVKWMPPEAFLDGIFTSKTDVWSFGVLLWEVMSMGYMPYPGRGNQEVMQLVTAGGRLESPNSSTPPQVYGIMTQCWNPSPEHRPTFATIIERLGYCLQDPDVLNVKLPVFQRAPSMERDMTLMRPPPDATDYLVPNNPCSNSNSNYSMSTEKTELLSPDTCSTFSCTNEENKLLELLDDVNPPVIPPRAGNWKETTFSDRNSNPKNQMATNIKSNGIKADIVANKASAQPLVLDASTLLQHPSRYMNVNVNDSTEAVIANNVRPSPQQINC